MKFIARSVFVDAANKAITQLTERVNALKPEYRELAGIFGATMLALLLNELGLKGHEESVDVGLKRLEEDPQLFDLLDPDDRQVVSEAMLELHHSLSVKRGIFVGLSDDSPAVVTTLEHENDPPLSHEEVRAVLLALGQSEGGETLIL